MAVVYKAKHKETLQSCAVKLILPHLAAQPGTPQRNFLPHCGADRGSYPAAVI
jgi:hypothetical protein